MSSVEPSFHNRLALLEEAVADIQQRLNIPQKSIKKNPEPTPPADTIEPVVVSVPKRSRAVTQSPPKPIQTSKSEEVFATTQPQLTITTPQAMEASTSPSSDPVGNFLQRLFQPEMLLNTLGTGLLLLGIIFMFAYAIANDWLTPSMWTGIGYLLGGGLLGLGIRLRHPRPIFSQFLLGGGVATFYITTYSAYALLGLLNQPLAFGLMSATTAGGYILSVWQRQQILALISVAGGFATPFLLPPETATIPGFVIYNIFVAAGSLAIYHTMRWRLLLNVTMIGSWAMHSIAYSGLTQLDTIDGTLLSNRIFLQVGTLFNWIGFGLFPVMKQLQDITAATILAALGPVPASEAKATRPAYTPLYWETHFLFFATPLYALATMSFIWDLPQSMFGYITLATALGYAAITGSLNRSTHQDRFVNTPLLTSLSLLTVGLVAISFENQNILFIIITVEALALTILGWLTEKKVIKGVSHILFVALTLSIPSRFLPLAADPFQFDALVTFSFIIALIVAARFKTAETIRYIYDIVANIILLIWLGWEIGIIMEATHPLIFTYIMLGFGIYACGWVWENQAWRIQSAMTLAVSFAVICWSWVTESSNLDSLYLILFATFALLNFVDLRRRPNELTAVIGHGVAGLTILWCFYRILLPTGPFYLPYGETITSLVDLIFIAVPLTIAWLSTNKAAENIYTTAANSLTMAWLWRYATVTLESTEFLASTYLLMAIGILAVGYYFKRADWRGQSLFTAAVALLFITNNPSLADLSLWGNSNFILIALFSSGLVILGNQHNGEDEITNLSAVLSTVAVMAWFAYRLIQFESPVFLFHTSGLIHVGIIILLASHLRLIVDDRFNPYYGFGVHLLVLGLVVREARVFENQDAVISAIWGTYGVGLLLFGVFLKRHHMRRLGLGTILLVVGKLFIIDLASVDTFIRIFLFIGFGILLLTTSYFFRSLWSEDPSPDVEVNVEDPSITV